MSKGNLINLNNQIKWTLTPTNGANKVDMSESFVIQDRKCKFLFHHGHNCLDYRNVPLILSIKFDEKEKFNPLVDVTIRVFSNSKMLSSEKQSFKGECQQMIWYSFDFELRSSKFTFEMIMHTAALKDDKFVQTLSYIDTSVLLQDAAKDFDKLFQEGPDYDVEFICGDETIKAHKNILCCRSKVFASMLRTDMKEGKNGQVKIQDMESGILRQFFGYLYTGKLSELTVDSALAFYEAADKYAVDALKNKCADFLVDNASSENACEILLMADRHSDPDFKKNVIEYMIKVEEPIVGEKWADFCKENSLLATEVLNLYIQHLRQKLNILKKE